MKLRYLIFFILLNFLSQTQCILNGDEVTNIDDFKYQVVVAARAVGETDNEQCGGGILTDRLILTAAHCFANPKKHRTVPDQEMIYIVAYTLSKLDGIAGASMQRNAAKVFVPASYFTDGTDDIAIVQLDKGFGRNSHKIKALTLPQENFVTLGREAVLAGYGEAEVAGIRVKDGKLRTMNVQVVEYEWAAFYGGRIIAARPTGERRGPKGFCNGDSGSPLVTKVVNNRGVTEDVVIGVVKANNKDCDDTIIPGKYINVSSYLRSFINKVMGNTFNLLNFIPDDTIIVKEFTSASGCPIQ